MAFAFHTDCIYTKGLWRFGCLWSCIICSEDFSITSGDIRVHRTMHDLTLLGTIHLCFRGPRNLPSETRAWQSAGISIHPLNDWMDVCRWHTLAWVSDQGINRDCPFFVTKALISTSFTSKEQCPHLTNLTLRLLVWLGGSLTVTVAQSPYARAWGK